MDEGGGGGVPGSRKLVLDVKGATSGRSTGRALKRDFKAQPSFLQAQARINTNNKYFQ